MSYSYEYAILVVLPYDKQEVLPQILTKFDRTCFGHLWTVSYGDLGRAKKDIPR